MALLLAAALAFPASVPLYGQEQPVATASRDLERLALVWVKNFPHTGYVIMTRQVDWERFRERYLPAEASSPGTVALDFSKGPVLGVIISTSGCNVDTLVNRLEKKEHRLSVTLRSEPNMWGPCQVVRHGGELVRMPKDVQEIHFLIQRWGDSVEEISIPRVALH
jgi:hypothetical protein